LCGCTFGVWEQNHCDPAGTCTWEWCGRSFPSLLHWILYTANCYKALLSVFTVPAPSVRIEPPTFTGSNITLRCSITLNAAVDMGIATGGVDVSWEGPQGNITSSSRIAISAVTGSGTMYESNLIFYALTMEDLGSYACRATVGPVDRSPYILMSGTGSDSETITGQGESVSAFLFDLYCNCRSCDASDCTKLSIQGCVLFYCMFTGLPSLLDLAIPSISVEGVPIAGQQYSLNCNITKIRSGLISSSTAQWLDSNGRPVTSTDSSIRETTTNTDQSTIHTITFSPLHTSHGGWYTCRGTAQSPLLISADTVLIGQNVIVTSKEYIICTVCVASLSTYTICTYYLAYKPPPLHFQVKVLAQVFLSRK